MAFKKEFVIANDDQIRYDTTINKNLIQLFGPYGKYVIQTEHKNQHIYKFNWYWN